MNPNLWVEFCPAYDVDNPADKRAAAWRVVVALPPHLQRRYRGIKTAAVSVGFARRKDAEIGMNALVKAGLDTPDKLYENRYELRRIMIEALPW